MPSASANDITVQYDHGPTLVIYGQDPLVPMAGGIDTAERISGAQLAIIDGMGRVLPVQL